MTRKKSVLPSSDEALVHDIRRMISEARESVAISVNATLTLLYWRIGLRIRQNVLKERRAEYGAEIVASLSRQLVEEHGSGFSEKNLRRMVQFAEVFADEQIVVSLIRHLSWTHFVALLPLKEPLQREFYTEMCRIERWSVRTLRQKIDSMLYERTAISGKPKELIRHELDALRDEDRLTPDLVFKDPYFLDFLGLRDRYLEKDLEDAILRELEQFLLELGAGFSFIARQKRIQVDNDDYYLDLLFFNRKLRRLVAVELKLGDFKPADKGQMELYLRWLDKYERRDDENAPIGLVLCAGKKRETVELLEIEKSSIRVAEYLTELPPRDVLVGKLHKALEHAKKQYQNQIERNRGE
ncbi:MAG: PDDEXK nuclease domain-containing protein [Syntrophobacteraceae bacterium]|jgi:predicted nuclease of restriction endonuclease-like (RecB) superfamily